MKVYKKSGSKERLFEMFENVNNMKFEESSLEQIDPFVEFMNNNETELYNRYKIYVENLPNDQNHKNSLLRKTQYFEDWVDSNFYDEKTNKYDLNKNVGESFDSPIEKDKDYLDHTQGDQTSQVSKYDDGVRYPVEDKLKVSDPSLEGLKGNDAPLEEENLDEISWSGVKNATKKVGGDISKGVSNAVNSVGNSISNYADGVVKSYHKGARNKIVNDLEKMAIKFGDEFGEMVGKINDRAIKAGDKEIDLKSLTQTIGKAIYNKAKTGRGNMSLSKFRKEGLREDEEEMDGEETVDTDNIAMDMGYEDSMEGGLADDAMPSEFDPEQIIKGIKVEMEHTNDPKQALEITMDHLIEIPDYYDHLDDMESEASEENIEMNNAVEEDCGCDDKPEDSLLDPSTHWVDHYTPKGISYESVNYPTPIADPEAGEEEHEEMSKLEMGEFDDEEVKNDDLN